MSRSIAVFGAAGGLAEEYLSAAREFGVLLGEYGWSLVFGGGRAGIMGAAADGAHQSGAFITGVLPELLLELEGSHKDCDRLEVTKTLHERLDKMNDLSDGFCIMPGGFGTLHELFEVIALCSLGYEDKPIVLVNVNGYYDRLIEQFEAMYAVHGARESCRAFYRIVETPKEAAEAFKTIWSE